VPRRGIHLNSRLPADDMLTRGARWASAGLLLAAAACSGVTPPGQPTPTPASETAFGQRAPRILTPAPNVSGDPGEGRRLIVAKGCAGCHTINGVPGATGVVGPNLTNVTLRPTIAGETIPNSPEMLVQWLLDPPAVKPGTTMPKLGLTEQEARDLVAFLESQPHTPQP
jgi:cytochrome c